LTGNSFSSLIIHQDRWTFFRSDCSSCPNVNTCVSGSSLHYSPRQYVLAMRGYRGRVTSAMTEGIQLHEEFQKGLPSFDQYNKFFDDLESGMPITLKELPICSRLRGGLRGHYDRFSIKKIGANHYVVEVTEFKRSYLREYLNQLIAYGVICSDPNCEVVSYLPSLRNPKKKVSVPHRLYCQNPVIDIVLRLRISSGKEYVWPFLEQNKPTEWGHIQTMRLMKLLKPRRRLHRFTITMFEALPYCRYCRRDGNEECSFWNEICSRVSYQPRTVSRRMFFGKKKLLVKSPPKLKLLPRLESV